MSTQTNTIIENLISEHIRIEDTSETKLFVRKINKHPNAKKKYIWREIKLSPHEASLYVGPHQPSTEEMLLDNVLTNKNFFDTCHGCGKLFHVDSLDNHLCNDCPTDALKQAFNKHHFILDSEIEGCDIPVDEVKLQVKKFFKEKLTYEPKHQNLSNVTLKVKVTSWNCQIPYTDFETILKFKESNSKADNEKIKKRIEQYLKREDILSSCLTCGLWNGSTFLDGGCGCECPAPPLPEGMVY